MEIAGSTVIVTGGASGIGAAFVRSLVDAGASVWVLDRDPSGIDPGEAAADAG